VVFESLFGARDVEGYPLLMFVAGFMYTIVSVFLSLVVHPDAASILSVGLATVAAAPLIVKVIEFEARMLELFPRSLATRQKRIIALYAWFMLGAISGFTAAYLLLPQELFLSAAYFQLQDLKYVAKIRAVITGRAVAPQAFDIIFNNNLRVYMLGVLLSFIYGTGGLFLITWNASIIATLLAHEIRNSGIIAGALHFFSILPHGILEFMAYFIGGFAGALVSVALFKEGARVGVIIDALVLFLLGIFLLWAGAWLESTLLFLQ